MAVIDHEATIQVSAKMMRRGKRGCLPVVDMHNKLLGILTENDLLRVLENLSFVPSVEPIQCSGREAKLLDRMDGAVSSRPWVTVCLDFVSDRSLLVARVEVDRDFEVAKVPVDEWPDVTPGEAADSRGEARHGDTADLLFLDQLAELAQAVIDVG